MFRSALLTLAVGLALADSSIVTLALPEILREFDVTIARVAWVLIAFNLVLALAAVPAAYVARRHARTAFVAGTGVFAAASALCGLAGSFEVLLAGRCLQAAGAAFVVCAALGLLSAVEGTDERAVRRWVGAGIVGAALGPAAGGLLTQTLGWESIFLLQVPLALLTLLAVVGVGQVPVWAAPGRPALRANLSLFLLSGALTAALFLLVLLLVDGWRLEPLHAGLAVTVMPLAALLAAPLVRRIPSPRAEAALGAILVAGGLAALGVLPGAHWGWVVVPQLFVGVGLGCSVASLTHRALRGRAAHVVHGGWTIAARHAGVVAGLAVLTPVFTAALDRNEEDALRAGAAAVLDSEVPPAQKLPLAQDVLSIVRQAQGELPDVSVAFEDYPDDDAFRGLERRLTGELERAVTAAFSRPFLLAAVFALATLVPLALARRGERS